MPAAPTKSNGRARCPKVYPLGKGTTGPTLWVPQDGGTSWMPSRFKFAGLLALAAARGRRRAGAHAPCLVLKVEVV